MKESILTQRPPRSSQRSQRVMPGCTLRWRFINLASFNLVSIPTFPLEPRCSNLKKLGLSGSVNSLECADLSALWSVAPCRDQRLKCFSKNAVSSRRRPKRRQVAALQGVDQLIRGPLSLSNLLLHLSYQDEGTPEVRMRVRPVARAHAALS